MAKMKVHEIAKELEKQSKEIIAFLQDKGIEVKAPQSSIEDDVADMVRKSFGTEPARKADRVEEKKVPDSGEKAEKAKVEEKKSTDKENKEAKPVQNGGEAPKKKKKIIFVSNPHNSNIPGQRQGNNDRRSGQGNRPSNGNRQNQNPGRQQQETRHKIIRPLTAPSMPETTQVDFKQNARRMESERLAAKNAQAAQTKVSMENTEKQAPVQKDVNVRPAAPKEERYQRNERTSGGTGNNQGERNERNNTRRPEGANRPAASGSRNDFRGNNADRNHNRPGSNHNRSERGAQGQDNRFKRPEKPGKSFAAEAPVKDEKRRDDEKRRMGQERDKKSKKDFIYEEDETAVKNKNKAGRFIKPEKKVEEAVEEQIKVITIPESLTIKELADKMKLQPSVIIKK